MAGFIVCLNSVTLFVIDEEKLNFINFKHNKSVFSCDAVTWHDTLHICYWIMGFSSKKALHGIFQIFRKCLQGKNLALLILHFVEISYAKFVLKAT